MGERTRGRENIHGVELKPFDNVCKVAYESNFEPLQLMNDGCSDANQSVAHAFATVGKTVFYIKNSQLW